eukprot:2520262-Pyramimonas_sp.AAC.1
MVPSSLLLLVLAPALAAELVTVQHLLRQRLEVALWGGPLLERAAHAAKEDHDCVLDHQLGVRDWLASRVELKAHTVHHGEL